jgi:hypothetical protein
MAADGTTRLPAVKWWTAWNEPNTATHLSPQYICVRGRGFWCKGGHFVPTAPTIYGGILKAIYAGVHAAGKAGHISETVAGGVTKPWGNGPTSSEPSMAPLKFMRLLAPTHAPFDVWAQHPYRVPGLGANPDNVQFQTLPNLFKQLDQLWPRKHYHVWITEYGLQTNPPDPWQGVSLSAQASALRSNVLTARKNPRIDMLIWFLINDEAIGSRSHAAGFQTGLAFANGKHKPAWNVFRSLTTPVTTS